MGYPTIVDEALKCDLQALYVDDEKLLQTLVSILSIFQSLLYHSCGGCIVDFGYILVQKLDHMFQQSVIKFSVGVALLRDLWGEKHMMKKILSFICLKRHLECRKMPFKQVARVYCKTECPTGKRGDFGEIKKKCRKQRKLGRKFLVLGRTQGEQERTEQQENSLRCLW